MKNEQFSSQDIPLIAYLCTRGHKIISQSEPDNFNRITFFFAKTTNLLEDLYGYQTNSAVPVQAYYRSLSYIWSLIKQEKRENG